MSECVSVYVCVCVFIIRANTVLGILIKMFHVIYSILFQLDLNALSSKVSVMCDSFVALCEQIPESVGNLQPMVDEIDSNMKKLVRKSSETSAELVKAENFKNFCHATEDLR